MSEEAQQRKLTREEELELWRAERAKHAKKDAAKAASAVRNATPGRRSFFALGPSNASTSFSSTDSGSSQPVRSRTRPPSATRASATSRAPTPAVVHPGVCASAAVAQQSPSSLMQKVEQQARAKRAAALPPKPQPEKPVQRVSSKPDVQHVQRECVDEGVQTTPPPEMCNMAIQVSLGYNDATVAQMREIVGMAKEDIARVNFVNAVLECRVQELETQTTRDMIDYDSSMDDIREKYRKELKRVTQEKQNLQKHSEEALAAMRQQLTEGMDVAIKRIEELEVELQTANELRRAAELRQQQLEAELQTEKALRKMAEMKLRQMELADEEDEEGEQEEHGEEEEQGDEGEDDCIADKHNRSTLSNHSAQNARSLSSLHASRSRQEYSVEELNGDFNGNDDDDDDDDDDEEEEEEEEEEDNDDNSTECASSDTDEHQEGDEEGQENAEDVTATHSRLLQGEQLVAAADMFRGSDISPIKSSAPPLQVQSPDFGRAHRSARRSTLCGAGRRSSESSENDLDAANTELLEPELEKKAEAFASVLDFDDDDDDDDNDFGISDEDEQPNAHRRRRRQSSMWDFKGRKSMQGGNVIVDHSDYEHTNRRYSHL